jgi:colanic acid biosynthesis glycosyl transferase WcaI
MRVLLTSLYFFPELTGIGVYSFEFARYLAQHGHEVDVLTTFPFYPQWKKHGGYPKAVFFDETIEGVRVHRVLTYVPRSPTSLRRIFHEVSFSTLLFFKALFSRRPDLLFCVSPPFLGMVAIALVSRLRRIPLHVHIQDLQPDTAVALRMVRGKTTIRILYWIERYVYRSATVISAISEGMLASLGGKGVPQSKLLLFPNWVSIEKHVEETSSHRETVKRSLNLQDKCLVMYSGNIGEKQGLETLIQAAAIAQRHDDDIHFLIVGDGAHRRILEKKAQAAELRNVLFLDLQPKERYHDMLAAADMSVVLLKHDVKDIVLPSKLINVLAAGSPVIASVNGHSEAAAILKHLSIDVLVEPQNAEALYQKILFFRRSPELMRKLSDEEKELARQLFSKDEILPHVVSHLEDLINCK